MQAEIEQCIAAGDTARALEHIESLLQEAIAGKHFSRASWAMRKKAQCLFMQSRLAEAVEAGRQSLEFAQQSGEKLTEAEAENALGIVRGEIGELEKAVHHLERSYRLYNEAGSDRVAAVLNNIGNMLLIMDDPQRALDYFREAIAAAKSNDSLTEVQGTALANVGRAYIALGSFQEAISVLRESVAFFAKFNLETLRVHSLTKLATALEKNGNLCEAEHYYREALSTTHERDNKPWIHELHGALGSLLAENGQYEEAEPHIQQAVALSSDTATEFDLPYWRRYQSMFLERRGDLAGALSHMKAAFGDLEQAAEKKAEKQLYQDMGRFEIERIEHEKEMYRLRNEELASALTEVETLRDALEQRNKELSKLVIRDPLTATFNRRWFFSRLTSEFERSHRHGHDLSVALIDLDHFKAVNDNYGHTAGDQILIGVSELLMRKTRKTDEVCRYGGEEFAIIMPETKAEQAALVVGKLRGLLHSFDWSRSGVPHTVTFSAGIASIQEQPATPDDLIDLADQRLYRAKATGRNRVVLES